MTFNIIFSNQGNESFKEFYEFFLNKTTDILSQLYISFNMFDKRVNKANNIIYIEYMDKHEMSIVLKCAGDKTYGTDNEDVITMLAHMFRKFNFTLDLIPLRVIGEKLDENYIYNQSGLEESP